MAVESPSRKPLMPFTDKEKKNLQSMESFKGKDLTQHGLKNYDSLRQYVETIPWKNESYRAVALEEISAAPNDEKVLLAIKLKENELGIKRSTESVGVPEKDEVVTNKVKATVAAVTAVPLIATVALTSLIANEGSRWINLLFPPPPPKDSFPHVGKALVAVLGILPVAAGALKSAGYAAIEAMTGVELSGDDSSKKAPPKKEVPTPEGPSAEEERARRAREEFEVFNSGRGPEEDVPSAGGRASSDKNEAATIDGPSPTPSVGGGSSNEISF